MSKNNQIFFKGMPRIRYWRNESLINDALKSPYYWWWAYLRLSKDYWWVCQRRGIADDARLKAMYRDFGRVYEMTFEEWWEYKGVKLFSEQVALPKVRELDGRDIQLSKEVNNFLVLEIPVNLTERTIIKQVREQLRQHPHREVIRSSSAKRQLCKLTGIRKDVIEIAYDAWQRQYDSRSDPNPYKIGQVKGTKSLYQIGKDMRLVASCMPKPNDSRDRAAKKVNGMKVAVSRMLLRANNLIENAAIGTFPLIQLCKEPIIWRSTQLSRLEEAVAAGQWRPLFDKDDSLIVP